MSLHLHALQALALAACLWVSIPVQAGNKDLASLRKEAAEWLSAQVEQAYPGSIAQVEIGPLDSRLRLDACSGLRFFLPAGSRLWSTGTLGAQCTGPGKWNLYLGFQVRLTGSALRLQHPLAARHLLSAQDVVLAQVRFEQDPGQYLREIPAGATTQRPLAAGQALLVQDLILPDVIQPGARVRVRASGPGFTVAQEGQALNAARAGASVQVKMPGGRIVRGLATQAGEVEIRP